jgi:hypothetical protein
MTYPCWIAPNQNDVEENKLKEPEGERIRAELIDFLERNNVCGILMDTPHHHVSIEWGPRLPNRIKPVLSIWGSIFVVVQLGEPDIPVNGGNLSQEQQEQANQDMPHRLAGADTGPGNAVAGPSQSPALEDIAGNDSK